MTKGIATCNLNVHKGEPSIDAPVVSQLVSGAEILILDVVKGKTANDYLHGSSAWYRLPDNQYVWSGGVSVNLERQVFLKKLVLDKSPSIDSIKQYNPSDYWWIKDFGIDQLWAQGLTGKGVKIAVLDSGLALPHPDLNISQNNIFDFTGSAGGTMDKLGHGTHVTGIIAASTNGGDVTGIAHDSTMYFGKVRHDIIGFDQNFLVEAIQWAVGRGVDIISISYGEKEAIPSLEVAVSHALASNILVVCAAGNKTSVSDNDLVYPARFEGTLSVGACNKDVEPIESSIAPDWTEIFAPGEDIKSTYLNLGYKEDSGSSQAAAYVSGVAALMIQNYRDKRLDYSAPLLKNELVKKENQKHKHLIIQPLNLIKS